MIKRSRVLWIPLVLAEYYQVTYTDCDKRHGYWSDWSEWSDCKCKRNYEVTRFGQRYVKERSRKCYCGKDGVETGCDAWCGKGYYSMLSQSNLFCLSFTSRVWGSKSITSFP